MRYRQLHRQVDDRDTPGPDRDASFRTGGCCSCCVEDEEDRCCCCRCACCEPEGISAEYIMGVIPVGVESEEEGHCCCCGEEREKEEEESMPPPECSVQPMPASAQAVNVSVDVQSVNVPSVQSVNASSIQSMNAPSIQSANASSVQSANVRATQSLPPTQSTNAHSTQSTPSQPSHHTPPVVVVPEGVLPANANGIPVLTNVHLVEAIAEDGSGKTVFVAVPNVQ